jgi:hypothetical protein
MAEISILLKKEKKLNCIEQSLIFKVIVFCLLHLDN